MYVSLSTLPISQVVDEQLSANHARRTAFLALPKEQLEAVDEGIRRYVNGLPQFIQWENWGLMVETPNLSMK
jgi:hypothetical protein